MPPFSRPAAALRTSQSLLRQRTNNTIPATIRSRNTTPKQASQHNAAQVAIRAASTQSTHGAAEHAQHGAAEHHGESHDMTEPPTGWLWGIPPGEQYQKEGWENIWYYGFYGSLIVATIAYAWKPDTSIETWALEEAKRRLQAEGTLPEDA